MKRFVAVLVVILLLFPDPATAAGRDRTEKRLSLAKAYLHNLTFSDPDDQSRWRRALESFLALADSAVGDRALFLAGRTAEYRADRWPEMRAKAALLYQEVADRFPDSRLADDALFRLAELTLRQKEPRAAAQLFAKIAVLFPAGDMAPHARKLLKRIRSELRATPPTASGDRVPVVDIRHGSTAYYSRVVIETTAPIDYGSDFLPADNGRPQRLYLDLRHARLPPELAGSKKIGDGVLARVRAAQYDPETVRVVLDVERLADYAINTRTDPFRIVVDVWGKRKPTADNGNHCRTIPSLADQLGLQARRIIIDPGHGGRDPGAINRAGMREKDISLRLAQRLAARLKRRGGYEVHLTRTCDTYLPLEERTAIANRLRGDIFVSLHVNSAESPQLAGIETYYLSLAESADEMRAAAAENAVANGSLNELEAILLDLMMNSKINESARLAAAVQEQMVAGLASRYPAIHDLGVKKAPFIVLIGAKMPAILAEVGFLSNPREAERLADERYLDAVAEQIASGIDAYARRLSRPPTSAGREVRHPERGPKS